MLRNRLVPLAMTVIPDNNVRADGHKVPHHFSTSMGVRKDDRELLTALNGIIKSKQDEIDDILESGKHSAFAERSVCFGKQSIRNKKMKVSKKMTGISLVLGVVLASPLVSAEITLRNALTGETLDMSFAKKGGDTDMFKQFMQSGKNPYNGNQEVIEKGKSLVYDRMFRLSRP